MSDSVSEDDGHFSHSHSRRAVGASSGSPVPGLDFTRLPAGAVTAKGDHPGSVLQQEEQQQQWQQPQQQQQLERQASLPVMKGAHRVQFASPDSAAGPPGADTSTGSG